MSNRNELSADVNPVLAFAIIALVICIFVAYSDFRHTALLQPFPSYFITGDHDRFGVTVETRVFHGTREQMTSTTDLTRFGVGEQLGAIARFTNGDWLLRTGARDMSMLENLSVYFRRGIDEDRPTTGDGRIMRCTESSAACEPFSTKLPTFARTFGLAIASDDTVFIADTSAHRLLKLSASGDILANNRNDFAFPNQLLFVDGALWVANTNRHELVHIDTATETFGRKLQAINVIERGAPREYKWPVSLARTSDGWWVLGKKDNLVGGAILRFDAQWNFRDVIVLPKKSDPAFIYAVQDHVYVTDMEHRRVLQLDATGTLQTDLAWPELTQFLQQSHAQAAHYQRLAQLCIAAFIGVLLGGVGLVWLQARDLRPEATFDTTFSIDDPAIAWIDIAPAQKRQFKFLMIAMVLMAIFFVATAVVMPMKEPMRFLTVSALPLAMLGLMLLFWQRLLKQRIGVKGDLLILVSANGAAAGRNAQILYTPQHLLIGNIAVVLGQPHRPLFSHEALVQQVFPLLKDARSISLNAMQMQLIRTANPRTLLLGVAALIVIAIVAFAT